jgi:exodeoxyribonuclease V alpha subunit
MFSEDEAIPQEARDKYCKDDKIHFSVTGYHLPAVKEVMLNLVGEWEKSKYGVQFKVDSYKEEIPKTKSGIISYLSSGLIKGVGKSTAELIVQKFGVDALDIIENDPKRLLEVKRISERKLKEILESYNDAKGLKDIMTFLGPYGVTPNRAKKIQEHFGSRALEVIQSSPFLLCEISGFGFKTVDEIARKVRFEPADPLRLEGGIHFILEEARDNGNLYLMENDLLERAYTMLSERVPEDSVTKSMVRKSYSFATSKSIPYGNEASSI